MKKESEFRKRIEAKRLQAQKAEPPKPEISKRPEYSDNKYNTKNAKRRANSAKPHRNPAKEIKTPVAEVSWIDDVHPLFVGQVRALWDLNLSVLEISRRLKSTNKKIQQIAEHYAFPDRTTRPIQKVNDEELELLREHYEIGTSISDIADMLGWNRQRVTKIASSYGFERNVRHPTHPAVPPPLKEVVIPDIPIDSVDELDEVEMLSEDEIKKYQLVDLEKPARAGHGAYFNHAVKSYEDQYRMENLKDYQEIEFNQQMQAISVMRNRAYATLGVIGETSGEIAGFDEDLLKTATIIKTCVEMLDKSLKAGTTTLKMDSAMDASLAGDMFNIDFLQAARQGGLQSTAPKAKRLSEDVE